MAKKRWMYALVVALMILGTSVGGCAASGDDVGGVAATSAALNPQLRLAWLGNSPTNTYDVAIREAAGAVALVEGGGKVTPFYALWNPATQLNQCLAAVQSESFDAILVLADDSAGIVQCVTEAEARGIPVVALDLPIGTDPDTVEPQVPGQAGAVLIPPGKWGGDLSALVVDRCAAQTECNVVYLAGTFGLALDDIAIQHLEATAAAHSNIHLVATAEAFYLESDAYTITRDLLASDPDIHMILAAGDQMAQGAERAIGEHGALPHPIDIVGAGAGAYGVQAVQEGRWYATFMALPSDEGALGAEIAIRAARGQTIVDAGINPVEKRGYPAFYTHDNQALFVDFTPQWPG